MVFQCSRQTRAQLVWWLSICALLVACMVMLGGAVRLTGSGLSMVDWKPIMGIIPPIGDKDWLLAFAQYKQFPEYQLVNKGMSLAEFQFIYYMEYIHRVLGRVLGMAFILPFLWFLVRGSLDGKLKIRLGVLLLLGACQGLMGWYMVISGLVDDPHVSHFRLTAHLMLAVVIFAYMIRLITLLLSQTDLVTRQNSRAHSLMSTGVLVLVLLMIATGGLVAGTRAGFIYNTWPLMGGDLLPEMVFAMSPWWGNFLNNAIAIQFMHRWLAFFIAMLVIALAFMVLKQDRRRSARYAAVASLVAIGLQITLGISTLVMQVPLSLGVLHRGGALLLLATIVVIQALSTAGLASQQSEASFNQPGTRPA